MTPMLKRFMDITVSSVLLVALSPILAAAALLVWLESGSPVLFRQMRVGLGFRQFKILKFRTMRAASGPSIF